MSTDWYRRKLAGGQAFQQRSSTPPLGPPPVIQQPQQAPNYTPNYPQQIIPQQQGHPGLQPDENGQVKAGDAIRVWGGGEGTKTEKYPCPSCGGNNFFTRSKSGSFGKPPAPRCFECGYNGMYEQFGNQPVQE